MASVLWRQFVAAALHCRTCFAVWLVFPSFSAPFFGLLVVVLSSPGRLLAHEHNANRETHSTCRLYTTDDGTPSSLEKKRAASSVVSSFPRNIMSIVIVIMGTATLTASAPLPTAMMMTMNTPSLI